ncbi:hypothetical protein ES702_06816 [subsurface metagenome]
MGVNWATEMVQVHAKRLKCLPLLHAWAERTQSSHSALTSVALASSRDRSRVVHRASQKALRWGELPSYLLFGIPFQLVIPLQLGSQPDTSRSNFSSSSDGAPVLIQDMVITEKHEKHDKHDVRPSHNRSKPLDPSCFGLPSRKREQEHAQTDKDRG